MESLYQTESFLTACISSVHVPDKPCMSQTSRDRVNSRRVRTYEKNSGDAFPPIGSIIQNNLGPGRSQHSLDRLEMARSESVPRGFSACAWKLSLRLFSLPDQSPLGLRGWNQVWFSRKPARGVYERIYRFNSKLNEYKKKRNMRTRDGFKEFSLLLF